MWLCSKCGYETKNVKDFCIRCGTKVAEPVATRPVAETSSYCPKCGYKKSGEMFCAKCGSGQESTAQKTAHNNFDNNNILPVFAIALSLIIIILQFQSWVTVSSVLWFYQVYSYNIFQIILLSASAGEGAYVFILVFSILGSILAHTEAIIRAVPKSPSSVSNGVNKVSIFKSAKTSGAFALICLTIVFCAVLFIVSTDNTSLFTARLNPVSYITVILGFINYFAFVRRV